MKFYRTRNEHLHILLPCLNTAMSTAFLAVCLVSPSVAAPFIPGSDSQVLEVLPTKAGDPAAKELRELRAALADNPKDPGRAVALAQRYFDLASAEGDPRYIGYAEAVIRPWLAGELPVEIQFTRALLRQYRHDFNNSIKDLDDVLARNPKHYNALSWKSALYLVMADYPRAREGCERRREVSSQASLTACFASIESLTGKAAEAYAALEAALKREPDRDVDFRQWVLTRIGEIALRAGNTARAERHFKEAIATGVTDGYVLAAYADLLIDQNRPREVVALLKDWVRSDILLLRLAIAEKMLQTPTAAARRQALADRFADSALRGDKLHLAEEARFELVLRNNPSRAVQLALENWAALQREPRDARILLEAALAARDPAAARPALEWLRQNRYQEAHYQELGKALEKLQQ
jgi:hypothetical protein